MCNGKALVAEDNASNQKLIAILLRRMGLEVTLADDGIEAIAQCDEQSFDIILMDMQMPNMNGYDATCQLRSQGVLTPIIAVTANAMSGDEFETTIIPAPGPVFPDPISDHLHRS